MRTQVMSSAVRITASLTEMRAMQAVFAAGAERLGPTAPDCLEDISALLDLATAELHSRRRDASTRRAAKLKRPQLPPMRNITVGRFTIAAHLGDYIDISPSPDLSIWTELTVDHAGEQREVRRGVWRVTVLNPSPYGNVFLASDCTETGDEAEIRTVAERLVDQLDEEMAA